MHLIVKNCMTAHDCGQVIDPLELEGQLEGAVAMAARYGFTEELLMDEGKILNFQKEYGFLRPITKELVERYLDWGNPRCGFAPICCASCGEERLLKPPPPHITYQELLKAPKPAVNILLDFLLAGGRGLSNLGRSLAFFVFRPHLQLF